MIINKWQRIQNSEQNMFYVLCGLNNSNWNKIKYSIAGGGQKWIYEETALIKIDKITKRQLKVVIVYFRLKG